MRSNSTPGQTAGRNIRAISPSPEGIDFICHMFMNVCTYRGGENTKTELRLD